MLYLSIRKSFPSGSIIIENPQGGHTTYCGYNKAQAIKEHRTKFNLKYKRINWVNLGGF